jgi:hypothetical protein
MQNQNQKSNAVAFDIDISDIKGDQQKISPAKLKVKERFEQRANMPANEN